MSFSACHSERTREESGATFKARSFGSTFRMTCCVVVVLACGCQQTEKAFARMGEGTQQLMDYLSGNTAIVAARKMEDRTSADDRRIGINELVARKFAQKARYNTSSKQIANSEPDR